MKNTKSKNYNRRQRLHRGFSIKHRSDAGKKRRKRQ